MHLARWLRMLVMPQANGLLSPGLPHGLAELLICLVGSQGLFAACAAHPSGRRQFLDRQFLDRHMCMTVPVQVAPAGGIAAFDVSEDLLDDGGVLSALASCVALPPASLQSSALASDCSLRTAQL